MIENKKTQHIHIYIYIYIYISLYNRDSGPGASRKTVSPFGGQVPWTLPRLSWTLPRPNPKSGLKPRCSAALLLGAIWVSFWSPGLSQTVLFGSLFVHFVVSGAKVRNALSLQREHGFGGLCGSQTSTLGLLEANRFGGIIRSLQLDHS